LAWLALQLLALPPLVGRFAAFETALAIAIAVTEQEAEAAMVKTLLRI
jgi:hypothetical protein